MIKAEYARLTEPYLVYLAAHDAEVTLPIGTTFKLFVKHRKQYIGEYMDERYGAIMVDTEDAEKVTV